MRGVIELEFDRRKKYKLFFIRDETSHEPSKPQIKLGSFSYQVILARAKLTRARTEPELSDKVELFCAVLSRIVGLEMRTGEGEK
jgi:hypothetical protein